MGILVAAFVAWKRRRATLGSLKAASFKIFARTARSAFFAIAAISLVAVLSAKPVPDNLGYGLDKLVESSLLLQTGTGRNVGRFNGYATAQAASYAETAIMDTRNRVLVDITLTGRVPFATLRTSLERTVRSLTITSVDARYRGVGVIEGYVSVDQASALARTRGVSAVFLVQKPFLDGAMSASVPSMPNSPPTLLGTTFDQGVTQHRVDKINQFYNPASPVNFDGSGITVGLMSDSYASNAASVATGVANFDLPGAGGNPVNTQPVVVLEDQLGNTDEGRAMVEIAYKMAPKAKLGFATAFTGEVGFANNIRSLAGLPGAPHAQPGFAATVIADDVSYGGEPIFSDGGIIATGVDDVTAAGVSYFSSAGNNIGINSYSSFLRRVPNTPGALDGTNINLTGVPPNLYQGGFHNFNPTPGQQDVAQLVNLPAAGQSSEMQWDDPYDSNAPVLGPQIFSATGTNGGTWDGTTTPALPPFTAGQEYVIQEAATSGNFDGIVTIMDPSNNTIVVQDTGTDETVTFFPPVSGQYRIIISAFGGTTGNFNLTVNTANGTPLITTDLNLLVFKASDGSYVASQSLTSNNVANNRPVELGTITRPAGETQVQFVISYANVPVAPQPATYVRWQIRGNGAGGIGPAEYFSYDETSIKGHAATALGNGTAAYASFRPSIPESFTSDGPTRIFFDRNNNRLVPTLIRLQPTVAAADAANSYFFASDTNRDGDTNPNFSGTSAAAPHAAAIAALVLQAHGGPTSVTPAQMTSVLERSAFPHDLDPHFASAEVRATNGGKVTFTVLSDGDSNLATGLNDPNSMSIAYIGPGTVSSFTFNPAGTAATGGSVTSGNNGVDASINYFSNVYPGMIFSTVAKPFTVGNGSVGLTGADVVAALSNAAPLPSTATQFWTLGLTFPNNNFSSGKTLRFTVGRGEQHSAAVGTFAAPIGGPPFAGPNSGASTTNPIGDLFGGGVLIPEGTVTNNGMSFSGTMSDASTFSGTIKNRIGAGYSVLDGYGFINAEAAVSLPLQPFQ